MDPEVYGFLQDFQATDRCKILLCHRPDSFVFGEAASTWDVDLVISGHLHGGQVVLPLLGGVFGGDQGWFPRYVHGVYEKEGVTIAVTSGPWHAARAPATVPKSAGGHGAGPDAPAVIFQRREGHVWKHMSISCWRDCGPFCSSGRRHWS